MRKIVDTSLINLITDKKNLSSIYNKIAIPANFPLFIFFFFKENTLASAQTRSHLEDALGSVKQPRTYRSTNANSGQSISNFATHMKHGGHYCVFTISIKEDLH